MHAFFANGTNPSACIVLETGLITFSLPKNFYSWREIFATAGAAGVAFIRKFEADKIGGATEGVYFDGKRYWLKSDDGWPDITKEDLVMRLRHRGQDADHKSDNTSEVERALIHIQEHRRISGVTPFLFKSEDVVRMNGERILNISTAKVAEVAETPQKWGENFPWLAEFIDTCWDESPVVCVEGGGPQPAKDVFLAWMHRFYTTAMQGALDKGQALFLAGNTGVGKTLLSTHVIANSVGGGTDATSYLMGDTTFNKNLFKVACWEVHDARAKEDIKGVRGND
ncbi:MAG TPA: hypothetical protein VGY75_10580 [Candidatus Udaeobacter sp.]|nr:hypothetical protein [Candidatus Udaeobacter sp.]